MDYSDTIPKKLLDYISFLWSEYGALSIIIIVVILFICGVIYLLRHPNEGKIIKSWILRGVVWAGIYDKLYVSSDIEGRLGRITKKEFQDLCNFEGVGIRWVPKTMTQEAFIKNGKLVMKVRRYKGQDENFLYATQAYVAEGIAPLTRNYLAKETRRAIDLVLIKEIVQKEKGESVLRIFANDLLYNEVLNAKSFASLYTKVEHVGKLGLLTRIFLMELSILASRLFPDHIGDREIINDADNLINFLEAFAKRPRHQEGELAFPGRYFKIFIVLLAIKKKIKKSFIPYLDPIESGIKRGYKDIHIFAYEQCLHEALQLATIASKKFQLQVKSKHTYVGVREDRSQIFRCIRLCKN